MINNQRPNGMQSARQQNQAKGKPATGGAFRNSDKAGAEDPNSFQKPEKYGGNLYGGACSDGEDHPPRKSNIQQKTRKSVRKSSKKQNVQNEGFDLEDEEDDFYCGTDSDDLEGTAGRKKGNDGKAHISLNFASLSHGSDNNNSSGSEYNEEYDKYDETINMVEHQKRQSIKLELNMSNLSNEKKLKNIPGGLNASNSSSQDQERQSHTQRQTMNRQQQLQNSRNQNQNNIQNQ